MALKAQYPKIVVTPPGPKARALLEREVDVLSQSVKRYYPLVADSGWDSIVRDIDGNEYIDFNSGIAVLNVGHSHPRILEAIKKQSEKLLHYSWTDFYYEPIVALGERLTQITPGGFKKRVFFGNSGSEANEAALKAARWHTRKQLVLAYTGAFHGRTMGALSLTASKPVHRQHFFPMVPGVTHVPFAYCYRCPFKLTYPECDMWCVDFIDEEVLSKYVPHEDTGAFFIEPIQGEGGYVVPPPDYFQRLKKRVLDKYNLLLVDDEIQSGMGRTGKWFALEHWDVVPDIITIAKALGSGIPIGAAIARADVMDWEPGSHASTFGGNPVACAAGLEVIEVIKQERLLENASKQGTHILARLKEMEQRYEIIGDVRGKGLMIGVEIVKSKETKEPGIEEAKAIMQKCFQRGLALITCGNSTIRLIPPLTISRELVDTGLEIFEGAVKEINAQKR